MAVIKGPITLRGGRPLGEQLGELVMQAVKKGEVRLNLPFEAKNWKSTKNAELVGGIAVKEAERKEFETLRDLEKIKGIGKATVDKLEAKYGTLANLIDALQGDEIYEDFNDRRVDLLKKHLLEEM